MMSTRNAAGSQSAANEKFYEHQDYTMNPDKSKEEIHRNPIRFHRQPDQLQPTRSSTQIVVQLIRHQGERVG